jgi:hypothetical protein
MENHQPRHTAMKRGTLAANVDTSAAKNSNRYDAN